jgi:hypothetical protein
MDEKTSAPDTGVIARRFDFPDQPYWLMGYASALGLAVVCWLVALALRADGGFMVWLDQQVTFLRGVRHVVAPYNVPGFVNTPWTLVLLLPFNLPPLEVGVLLQLVIYFAALVGVIFKFGGERAAVLLTLTSPLALDATINLNVDWLVCLGLLVPPWLSGPLLLVKPQIATGYLLGFKWREFVRWLLVTLVTLLASLLIWGVWPLRMLDSLRAYPVSWSINLAPAALLTWPVALALGAALAAYALRRRDSLLGILAGLFFVPYIASYSLLLPYALVAARWPVVAATAHVTLWALVIVTVTAAASPAGAVLP